MRTTKATREEVTDYVSKTYGQEIYEWLSDNRFVDYHGCDGYIFKDEDSAKRYITKMIKRGEMDAVQFNGIPIREPSCLLSTYSGRVSVLSNSSLLFY